MKKIVPSIFLLCTLFSPILAQTDIVGSGRTLHFDGADDYIDLGNIYDDLKFPLTISAWVYKDGSTQYLFPIFASQDNTSLSLYNGFWFCLSATNLFFEYGDGRGDQSSAYRKGKSAPVPNLSHRWIHVSAVVNSGSDIQLFVNGHNVGGSYVGGSSLPMASNYPGDVAKIGFLYTNSVAHRFQGMIDELRIWNRALSETEIRQSMCRRLKGNEAGLIGYWNFDETGGDQVRDLSPNGFHGTLKGNPARVYSGAPVGDESVYLYTNDWAGSSLSLRDLSVTAVNGNPYGVHIYSVNSIPSQTGGLSVPDVQLPYYGVFLADDSQTNTFDLAFNGNNVCKSFTRNDNSESQWHAADDFSAIVTRLEIIPFFEPSGLNVDLGSNTFLCNENSSTLRAVDDPSGKTFLWNNGQTSNTITVTASGAYSVEVKQGCLVGKDTVEVSFGNSPPTFSLGEDELLCVMEPRTLTAMVGSDAYARSWQDGSNATSFVATDFGTYWLKIENACGSSADTVRFVENKEPDFNVDLGEDVTFCKKLPFALLAHAEPEGKTFQWNTGEKTPAITVISSGTYTVEVSGDCKTDRDTIYISYLSAPPAFSLGPDEALCSLEPRTLKPEIESTGFDVLWQDGSKETTFTAHQFGTYWVKIENACGIATDSITFTKRSFTDLVQYNFISPDNQDDRNQFFVLDERLSGSHLTIFNRWGKPVYESFDYQNNWDGNGLPAGVYFYTIGGECIEPLKGTLTIMR